MVKVQTIACSECKQQIYSIARHDFHYCKCGETYIDGGFDYIRMGGSPTLKNNTPEIIEVEIDATLTDFCKDWVQQTVKYGWIG